MVINYTITSRKKRHFKEKAEYFRFFITLKKKFHLKIFGTFRIYEAYPPLTFLFMGGVMHCLHKLIRLD